MTKLSYRDILSRIFDDKELVEFLVEYVDAHKNFGAFRIPKFLPPHTIVTLIDRVKMLEEQQISFYTKGKQDTAYDLAVETDGAVDSEKE